MENLNRAAKSNEFVAGAANRKKFTATSLTADASTRKYYRLTFADGKTAVLMDDEGCRCKTREFVELSKFLRARGVYVPEVFAADFDNGFLLLEDLGDDMVSTRLTVDNEKKLYLMSAEALAKVAAVRERPQCAAELTRGKILEDLRLFTDWYIPMATGRPLSMQAEKEFFILADRLSELAYRVPNRLVLWDYHIDNIMLPPGKEECAIIDFQDAMWGPLTYDIMSLLAADRRVASDETIAAVKDAFFASLNNIRREDFEDSYAFLALFRHLRVLGRFTTLSMVNGKNRYLQYIPQMWKALDNILKYPKLSAMARWMEQNLPAELRKAPTRKPVCRAMVLAAGRGVRMQNLTDDRPKPLIRVNGRELIDYNFDRLREFGIKDVVVNLCYKGEMIKEHLLASFPDFNIAFSEEEEALETGGGIKNALPLLKDEAFLTLNSDVFFIDRGYKPAFWRMLDAWDEEKHDILLLLQNLKDVCGDKGIGDYRLTPAGTIERNKEKKSGYPYMFAGISIVNRRVFDNETRARFSLRDCFDAAEKSGRLGFVVNEAEFFHVGTPQALKEAEAKIHRQKQKKC